MTMIMIILKDDFLLEIKIVLGSIINSQQLISEAYIISIQSESYQG